ncbi:MAG: UDP-N-acetylmuramoyl-L-alanyl-D-glutamate--2,6-diaminopimelate ligase [Thermodesulfobacterium geofontis]|uniref:UDP-N-acetylmuramoyl-L-alanyl-D-glutamate--2,6-diaminopimelate ligase n=1 Tax=Thermodesulfobacterium geofontis TaxID=1295609 RepID=A0A2N7QG07_9BACT|nr:MAG: UDP-N-acetylmuramoyl-L-alanyl-D-glutamate--2,6-diaminopimelate ligase [Thermodesulfobacterium geofontis]
MKPLEELIQNLEIIKAYYGSKLIENFGPYKCLKIKGISENSKEIKDGFIFVARKGTNLNGEAFIEEALKNGALIIVRESDINPSETYPGTIQIQVKDVKKALSTLSLNFYENPQEKLFLIGVTGTNGKTSVSYFTKNILNRLGVKCGYIGTLFYETDRIIPALETTPSILTVASLLKEMVDKGFKACVIEVSSHALHQDRLLGLFFDVTAFTNLSRDHLDYHKDMEDYYQAKKKLFTQYLKPNAKVVVSLENEYGKRLAEELKHLSPIFVNNEEFKCEIFNKKRGSTLKIEVKDKEYEILTQLLGDYQAKNLATTLGILSAMNYKIEDLLGPIQNLKNPIGRLELVAEFKGAKIFVDYAHTPEALASALKSLKTFKENKLIVIFGCGGNRDKGKRPLMGKVASLFADEIILTSDNPRFEDPLKIIEDIKKGINSSKPYRIIPDRREALEFGIKNLQKGDVLLVAGKGHETYQEIKGKRYPFSDQEEILKIIKNLKTL